MTKQQILGLIISAVCIGIWAVGFIDGARSLWWEPVIWAEVITYVWFRSIDL